MRGLTGKVAVVVGAGSGIGRATAQRLAEEGARVAVVDIDGTAADTTVTALESSYFTTTRSALPISSRAAAARSPINAEVLGSDAVRSTMLDAIPMERLGRPADVAATIAFLASSDADFVSGADIVVDGAMIASASWGTARTAWRRNDSASG